MGYQLLLRFWDMQKQQEMEAQSLAQSSDTNNQAMSAREEFARLVNELQKSATKKSSEQSNSVTVKFSFSDYTVQQVAEHPVIAVTFSTTFYSSAVNIVPSPAAASPGQPPDFTV